MTISGPSVNVPIRLLTSPPQWRSLFPPKCWVIFCRVATLCEKYLLTHYNCYRKSTILQWVRLKPVTGSFLRLWHQLLLAFDLRAVFPICPTLKKNPLLYWNVTWNSCVHAVSSCDEFDEVSVWDAATKIHLLFRNSILSPSANVHMTVVDVSIWKKSANVRSKRAWLVE